MRNIEQQKISLCLILGILFFLVIFLQMGYVNMSEQTKIFSFSIPVWVSFALSCIFCIHYKKNYKTLAFWVMILLGIGVCITLFLLLLYRALSNVSWN